MVLGCALIVVNAPVLPDLQLWLSLIPLYRLAYSWKTRHYATSAWILLNVDGPAKVKSAPQSMLRMILASVQAVESTMELTAIYLRIKQSLTHWTLTQLLGATMQLSKIPMLALSKNVSACLDPSHQQTVSGELQLNAICSLAWPPTVLTKSLMRRILKDALNIPVERRSASTISTISGQTNSILKTLN
jgi:hypothetical protein